MGKGAFSYARKGAMSVKSGQVKSYPTIRGRLQLWNNIDICKKDDVIAGKQKSGATRAICKEIT